MKIRRVLEELEVTNDINLLKKEELEKKYFGDKETYDHFLKTYFEYFTHHLLYPIRSSLQFNKVAEVMNDGNQLYPSDDNISYQEALLSEMESLRARYKIDEYNGEERVESQYIFKDGMGSLKAKDNLEYEEIVSRIKNGCEKYLNRGEYPLGDFGAYVKCKQATCRNQAEVNLAIDRYLQDHPLSYACNDKDYLYFVNYMTSIHKKDVNDQFITDAIDVISTSRDLQKLGLVRPGVDIKEYNRVAKHTLKSIRVYEKSIEKKEKKTIGLLKRKSK